MQKVSFAAKDGVEIKANYFECAGEKAVLLLHQNRMSKESWQKFAQELNANNFASLAIDLRGYGESVSKKDVRTGKTIALNYQNFSENDYWPAMMNDINAAKKFLQENEKTEIFAIGSSIGANLALNELASGSAKKAVALSPGLDYFGIDTESIASKIRKPCLIIASSEDRYSAESSQMLVRLIGKNSSLILLENAGHGVSMLAAKPELTQKIMDFLKR
ncbi:MAG: alpha/beta fold hydrolase [archaeon]